MCVHVCVPVLFFLWSNLVNPNLTGSVTLTQLTAISCIINTVSLFFSGIQDRPAGTPPILSRAACGKFHAITLQEASDHVPHISDQFIANTGNTDLAILLNKDTFEPDPTVFAFKEDSTSKSTWGITSHRARPAATPFSFQYSDGHMLLCTHPQRRDQET